MTSGSRTFIGEARRVQIIDRAIEALPTLGYQQASLAKIAKLSKITPGQILIGLAAELATIFTLATRRTP